MATVVGVFRPWVVGLLLVVASAGSAVGEEELLFGLREFSVGAWADNDWRLLYHDPCYRPKTLLAWRGTERTYVNGTENEPLESDRPDFTQASTVVGLRRVQVESGYTFIRSIENYPDVTASSFPELLLRVGVLAEWLEMRVGWNTGTDLDRRNITSNIFDGADEIYLGAKVALTEQNGWLPEMVILPQMNVPLIASAGNGLEPGINWLYSWTVNSWLEIAGSTQVNRASDSAQVWYAEFAQSLSFQYKLTEGLAAYTEWFAFFPSGSVIELPQQYADGGFTWHVNPNLQLDIRAGVGLNSAADNFFTGSGIVTRF